MTVLSVCQDVASVVGLKVPTLVFGSTAREHVELAALANEMAKRIAFDTHDWQMLKSIATINGNGTAEDFALPSDYRRMLKKARLWPSSSPYSSLTHYPDADEWLGISVQAFTPVIGAWTLIGGRIAIKPVVASGATVKYMYLSNAIITGTDATQFVADDDAFKLDERVLKLGMVWQWRANKGVPYGEDMENYEAALASAIGADKGSNILVIGTQRLSGADRAAYPGVIVP
jgi:hypothetical protein